MDLPTARAMVVFGMVMGTGPGLCHLYFEAGDKRTQGSAKEKYCFGDGVLSLPGMGI